MSPSVNRQTPWAMAVGGVCLLGIGITGCSRDNGLSLGKQDPRTDTAIAERANDSILRSKKELAGTKGGAKGSQAAAGLAETEPDADEKPTLASRWRAPFKGAGNLFKKKPAEDADDPFLAQSKPKDEKESAKVRDSIATLQQEKALEAKSASADGKKLAMADSRAKKGSATDTTNMKPLMSTESKAALDEFLKSQEPIGVEGRALAAGYEKETLTQKPGTSARPKKSPTEPSADQQVANAWPTDPALEHRTLGSKSVASTGTARPFPADFEAEKTPESAARPTSKLRQSTAASDGAKLADADRLKRANPLAEDSPTAPTKTKQATGREIAGLLKKAKQAGDRGKLDEAMSYAVAASDLAEQCSYEFAAGEQTPAIVVDWVADKQAEAQQLSRGVTERRMLASRKQQKNVDALPTSFSTPTAHQVFEEEVREEKPAAEVAGAVSHPKVEEQSSFNEWAATVGKQPPSRQRSPEWPVLSAGELAASDDLWQPSRSTFEQNWTMVRNGSSERTSTPPRETRLASAETDAPAFVATADGAAATPPSVSLHDSIVQLGQPTDLAPELRDHLVARADGSTGVRRGPRLAAPPPLSIEEGVEERASTAVRSKGMSRMAWYGVIGGLAVVLLLGFRRWAFRAAEKA